MTTNGYYTVIHQTDKSSEIYNEDDAYCGSVVETSAGFALEDHAGHYGHL